MNSVNSGLLASYLRRGVYYEGRSQQSVEALWADYRALPTSFWRDLFYNGGRMRYEDTVWLVLERTARLEDDLTIPLRKSYLAQMGRVMRGDSWPDRVINFLGDLHERRWRAISILRQNPSTAVVGEARAVTTMDPVAKAHQENVNTAWTRINSTLIAPKSRGLTLPFSRLAWLADSLEGHEFPGFSRRFYQILKISRDEVILQVPLEEILPGVGRNPYRYETKDLDRPMPIPVLLGADGSVYLPDGDFLSLVKIKYKGQTFVEVSVPAHPHPNGDQMVLHILSWEETFHQHGWAVNSAQDREAFLWEFGMMRAVPGPQ